MRSGCADPEHPVAFGVGARDDGARVVQFASFTFDAAVLALADSELADSAGDDPGEAVWRALTENPIADLCRSAAADLAADLQKASLGDTAPRA